MTRAPGTDWRAGDVALYEGTTPDGWRVVSRGIVQEVRPGGLLLVRVTVSNLIPPANAPRTEQGRRLPAGNADIWIAGLCSRVRIDPATGRAEVLP